MAPPYTSLPLTVVNPSTYNTGCSGVVGRNANCGSGDQDWTNRSCGGCANASCAGGNQLDCLRWPGTNSTASQYCPTTCGHPISATYNGSASQKVICQYDTITIPFDQLGGYFDTTTSNRIKNDICSAKNFDQLSASADCMTYYGSSHTVNYEKLKRLQQTNKQWVNNRNARSFINNILKKDPTIVSLINTNSAETDQETAKNLVSEFCEANPNGTSGLPNICACYNTIKYGTSGCKDHGDYPGCSTLNATKDALDALNATIQFTGQTDYFCLSSDCADARNSSNQDSVMLSDVIHTCDLQIQTCINDLSQARLNNSTVSTECKNTLGSRGGGGGDDTTSLNTTDYIIIAAVIVFLAIFAIFAI